VQQTAEERAVNAHQVVEAWKQRINRLLSHTQLTGHALREHLTNPPPSLRRSGTE